MHTAVWWLFSNTNFYQCFKVFSLFPWRMFWVVLVVELYFRSFHLPKTIEFERHIMSPRWSISSSSFVSSSLKALHIWRQSNYCSSCDRNQKQEHFNQETAVFNQETAVEKYICLFSLISVELNAVELLWFDSFVFGCLMSCFLFWTCCVTNWKNETACLYSYIYFSSLQCSKSNGTKILFLKPSHNYKRNKTCHS